MTTPRTRRNCGRTGLHPAHTWDTHNPALGHGGKVDCAGHPGVDGDAVADLVAGQLAAEVHRVETCLAVVRDTARIAAALCDADRALNVVGDVIAALHPDGDPPLEWWRTPLGIAVAREVGCEETIADPALLHRLYGLVPEPWSRAQAGRVLGVSGGTVAQLLARGTVARHPGSDGVHRGVNRASVLAYLARRGPRDSSTG